MTTPDTDAPEVELKPYRRLKLIGDGDAKEFWVGREGTSHWRIAAGDIETADRIAACLNACEGLSDEILEKLGLGGMNAKLIELGFARDDAERMRKELE